MLLRPLSQLALAVCVRETGRKDTRSAVVSGAVKYLRAPWARRFVSVSRSLPSELVAFGHTSLAPSSGGAEEVPHTTELRVSRVLHTARV